MMWNPSSDNNKTEDVSIAETANDQQQQQLNIVDNKSVASQQQQQQGSIAGIGKSTTKNLEGESSSYRRGGGVDSYCAADTSSSISCGGGVDSGFLSGPQLVEDYDVDDDLEKSGGGRSVGGGGGGRTVPSVQLNIVHKQQFTDNYQDSGCIDEDLLDEDLEEQHKSKPSITTTAATPQTQQRTIFANTIADSEVVERGSFEEDDQMILDSGVDAGISEWFCKLNLKASNPLNNLGAASERTTQDSNDEWMEKWQEYYQQATGTYLPSYYTYYQQNDDGDTQLHLACLTGNVAVVAALIRMALDRRFFDIQNDEAQTALHLAALYGQPKILRMLLIAGAEPTVRDRNGNTALHLACLNGDIQCVKALTIKIGSSEINEAHRAYGHLSSDKTTSYLDCADLPADLEIRNYDGERCVHLAAQGGHIDILRHLECFGADINAREGKSGRTPLHIAIECGNEIVANFLLKECPKLDLETATYAGLTAYQVACILNNSAMQNNLEKRGAEPLTPPDSDYESSDIETDLDDSQMYDRFGDPRFFAIFNGGGNPINVA